MSSALKVFSSTHWRKVWPRVLEQILGSSGFGSETFHPLAVVGLTGKIIIARIYSINSKLYLRYVVDKTWWRNWYLFLVVHDNNTFFQISPECMSTKKVDVQNSGRYLIECVKSKSIRLCKHHMIFLHTSPFNQKLPWKEEY